MKRLPIKTVRVCPHCGSTDVGSNPLTDSMGAGIVNHLCNACGFSGVLFPEVAADDVESFRRYVAQKPSKRRREVT